MTLWWIGAFALLVVVFPRRRVPAERRAIAAQSIVPSVEPHAEGRRPPPRRISTPPRSC